MFLSNRGNYYYSFMPFGLKNIGATYQRHMDVVYAQHIGQNIDAYINDMIIKIGEGVVTLAIWKTLYS